MRRLLNTLHGFADNSRWILVAGLLLGIFLPPLADLIKPWVGYWVAVLLFIAALRIDPRGALGTLRDYKHVGIFIVIFQVAIPTILAVFFLQAEFSGPLAIALLIVMASAPISGSPGLAMMTGNQPAPTIRLLISTMALLPLTVFLPFSIVPFLGSAQAVSWIAFKLFLIIFLASLSGFAVRHFFMSNPSPRAIKSIDGLTAITMAIVVIGLMTGFGEAVLHDPVKILTVLLVAFAVNFGMQILVWFAASRLELRDTRAAFAICAGNKNMAIFLAALPAVVTDPILHFIACYQIPMYLTPMLLRKLYER